MRSARGHDEMNRKLTGRRSGSALGLIALLLVAATACGNGEEQATRETLPPLPVQAFTAGAEDWSDGLSVTGSVQPFRRATPGTVLMGRVDRVLREEGDAVREGEVLARVESRDVAARVAQAEAAVAAARAMERNALRMKERMERLHARQAASQKDLDDATAGYEAAVANLRAAEEGVRAAEVYLDYSEVKAPFAGVVAEKRVEAGDTAAPGMPLFVIEQIAKVKIEAQVPESVASGLSVGDPVEVEVGNDERQAELTELLPSADPRSRTFTVRALLDNPGLRLRAGMFARLRLGGEQRRVIPVPQSSIVRRGPLTGLFVVDASGTARLRWVSLGRTRADRVEVLTGLVDGERVVDHPDPSLEDGRPVEVR